MPTGLGDVYLLYSGISQDGSGAPVYSGRTLDVKEAAEHFKECKANRYSIGRVVLLTDTAMKTIFRLEEILPKGSLAENGLDVEDDNYFEFTNPNQ